jgi:hypothetical protein
VNKKQTVASRSVRFFVVVSRKDVCNIVSLFLHARVYLQASFSSARQRQPQQPASASQLISHHEARDFFRSTVGRFTGSSTSRD